MNIDWNQTIQGYNNELEKSGDLQANSTPKTGPMGEIWNAGANLMGTGAKLVGQGVDKVKSTVQKPINYVKDEVADAYNNSLPGQAQAGLDNLGNIASSIAPLGLAAMMSGGMGGGGGGQQGQTVNNYYGNQGSRPTIFNQSKASVGSLSSPSIKTSGLVDTVAGVVRNRAINNLIDKSVASEDQAEGTPEAAEKEVEITSKYPEMSKLLEDEQNKAYLQKLLKN